MRALRAEEAGAPVERAAAEHAVGGDRPGAARAALQLAQLTFGRRDAVVAKGWQTRAARLVEDFPDAPEQGHLAWLSSRFAAVEGRLDEAAVLAGQAIDVGRRHDEPDIEVAGLPIGDSLCSTEAR